MQSGSEFFTSPGDPAQRRYEALRERVLAMRALDKSVKEIADALNTEGTPISHQSVWVIVSSEGLSRLPPRARRGHGPPPRTEAVRASPLEVWPAGASMDCAHAGLFVLFPAMVELGVDRVIAAGGYPSTSVLSSWHSMASLLTLKLLRAGRVSHATSLAADEDLGLAVGLNVLPKTTHARPYSYRVRREMN